MLRTVPVREEALPLKPGGERPDLIGAFVDRADLVGSKQSTSTGPFVPVSGNGGPAAPK